MLTEGQHALKWENLLSCQKSCSKLVCDMVPRSAYWSAGCLLLTIGLESMGEWLMFRRWALANSFQALIFFSSVNYNCFIDSY